ncbi:MAG: hypothetical protein AB7I30_14185 [Isosphaeraceae bacterium]
MRQRFRILLLYVTTSLGGQGVLAPRESVASPRFWPPDGERPGAVGREVGPRPIASRVIGPNIDAGLSNDADEPQATNDPRSSGSVRFAGEDPSSDMRIRRLAVADAGGETTRFESPQAIKRSDQVEYEWTCVTEDARFPWRDGAGALTFKGRMWLLGGWNSNDEANFPRYCVNEVRSSQDGIDWIAVRKNTFSRRGLFDPTRDWEGRHTAGYAVFNDKMWIIGGDVNQGHYHFDVWNSEDGVHWTLVNKDRPVPWGPRALHHTVVHNGKIWVLGGQTIPQIAFWKEVFHRDLWNSADGLNWRKVEAREPFWPQRGMIGGSAVFQGRIWVLGGGTYDTPNTPRRKYFNDVWSSEDGVSWTRHTSAAPWFPRQYHDVAVFDGRLWVLEGYNEVGGNRNDVWYSQDGANWFEVPNTPWAPRHAASVFVHDGSLWMVAGNNMKADVWRLRRKTP